MDIEVRLFASLKDRAGQARVRVSVAEPATVQTVTAALADAYPALAPALPVALVAVNQDFAFPQTAVAAGDEIALFPPVSGGASTTTDLPYPTYFAVDAKEPDVRAITRRLTEPEVGAIVFFHGTVRGATDRHGLPDKTLYLEYEAYTAMALRKMEQIAHEIWDAWPLVRGVAIVQRIGKLAVGDTTTFVACASGHRDQGAFEAARYGIDRLKEIVPVWKKEMGEDKSVWVEGTYRPTAEDRQDS
jgi:molybdopterin synthase catalytic subunit